MAYEVVMSALAEKELDNALSYIAVFLSSPHAALDLLDEYEAKLTLIAENPFLFSADAEISKIARQEIRKASVKNYLLYYFVDKGECRVCIAAFLHAAQDASYAFLRRSL